MADLVDVNVVLALVTDRHEHHDVAARWIANVAPRTMLVCRTVQIGLLRLLNNPTVMQDDALSTDECWAVWRRLLGDERVEHDRGEPGGLDESFAHYTRGRMFSPRLWSDAYLAAFATVGGHTLVTFDRGFRRFEGLTCTVLAPS